VGTGSSFAVERASSGYVRAEITDGDGSVVYTQAFVIRPVGDVDGDRAVDRGDAILCESTEPGTLAPDLRLACDAIPSLRPGAEAPAQ